MGEQSRTLVWRWKGTRVDIVRIATAAVHQVGAPAPFLAEVVDGMGKAAYRSLEELAAGLEGHESFLSLGLLVGSEGGPCRILVYFTRSETAPAAVTVDVEGSDAAAVQLALRAISGAVRAGAREPKDMEPSTVEGWAAGIGIGSMLLALVFGLPGFQDEDYELILAASVFLIVGTATMYLWIGYDTLIPRIELLHPGQSPRVVKFGLWFAGVVASIFLAAALGLS